MFADGTKVAGNLLVGADGLHSSVRARAFVGPAPRYAGYVAWRGVVDEPAVPAAARELIAAYGFFLAPREMVIYNLFAAGHR